MNDTNQLSLPWLDIDTVLLDMDGTLLDLNFDNHFWLEFVPTRYAARQGLPIEQAKSELLNRYEALKGKLEWYCLDYWSRELQLDLAGLKQEIAGLISTLPHVIEFLEAIRASGKTLCLVTNAHPDALALKMGRTCLHRFFDQIFCSHQFGVPREMPEFWPRLQQVLPFQPQRTLMIDDSLSVLMAAAGFGITHTVAIAQPDSQQPSRNINGFPTIEDLGALLPVISLPIEQKT